MVRRERHVRLEHLRQHAGGGRTVHHLSLFEDEGVGVRRDHQRPCRRAERKCLFHQPLVPALVEVHVRVELQEPLLAVMQ